MQKFFLWLASNYIELIGSILGIVYVLLASRQNIWCWITGIVSCGLYIIVFFIEKLYGDMSLQFFYLIMGFYGWYVWTHKKNKTKKIYISAIPLSQFLWMSVFVFSATFIFGYILSFTDDPIPYWDGFTNALGLAGTWMIARKYLENWLLWIFANSVCVAIYYYKGLYPTVIFYFIMSLLALRGYNIWKNEIKN